MEILMVILIIVVVLMIIGVNAVTIGIGVLTLLELLSVLMALFFLLAIIIFFFFKRKKAHFLRIHITERKIHFALYEYSGEEYQNLFPVDRLFANKFYKNAKISTVHLRKGKKRNYLFDWYSILVMSLGFVTFTALSAGIGWFIVELLNFNLL